jgi:hypothetical protein
MLLITVAPNKQLSVPTGLAYNRAVAAGAPPHITSAWRDPVYQAYLRAQYLAGVPGFNFALAPDESKHCLGLAIDVPGKIGDTSTAKGWFAAHGEKFGFFPVANEDWHFEYRENQDPSKPNPKEDEMPGRNWFGRTVDQPLVAGKWTTVKINDKGDISVAIGNKAVTANVWVDVRDMPIGAQVQMRFYIVDVKSGKTKRVNTLQRTLTEYIGTAGSTFLRGGVITGLKPTERLRAEVWVETAAAKATIINAGADALTWN